MLRYYIQNNIFIVNTPGAEVLYRTIKEWCNTEQEDTCVLGMSTYVIELVKKFVCLFLISYTRCKDPDYYE